MRENAFQENIKVGYSEKDYNLVLKPSFLLQFLQDLATDNAESLGFGYSFINQKNLAWYLLKYHMEFSDYPEKVEELTIKTEPRGYNKIFAFRDFEICKDGNCLGKVTSTWALVDVNSKSMVNISDALDESTYMRPFEKREDDLNYCKIKPLERIDNERVFEIRFDDIDVNKHANNTNYIIWAFEPLDIDFRHDKKLKTLDMVYKKEITYGCKVLSQVEINGNVTKHLLKNYETNEDLCIILAEWTKR